MSPPSLRAAARNCRSSSLCTAALAEDGDRHRLVVQFGAMGGGVRRDLAIGVKAGKRGALATSDAPLGPEHVPASGAAMAHFDGAAVEADRCDPPGLRHAVQADI